MQSFTSFSEIFSIFIRSNRNMQKKNSRHYIPCKIFVESKYELRIGVKIKGSYEIENKQKNKDFDVYINIYVYSDSGN